MGIILTLNWKELVLYELAGLWLSSSEPVFSNLISLQVIRSAGLFIWHIQNKKALWRGPNIIN